MSPKILIFSIFRRAYRILRRVKDTCRGYYPEFVGVLVLTYISRKPKTFQQKIKYKMAHDRRNFLCTWADKVEVRKYVASQIGEQYLVPIYSIFENPDDVILEKLPEECVIKPNHGSGAVLIFSNREVLNSELPGISTFDVWKRYEVKKSNVDEKKLKNILDTWLKTSYSKGYGHFPEFAYKGIKPKILVEQLLTVDEDIASDYRFFIFNGKCDYIEVDQSWNLNPTRDMFDRF